MSPAEISNAALIKIGANLITAFEDGTHEAKVARSLCPLVRDFVLTSHPSEFAVTRVGLGDGVGCIHLLPDDAHTKPTGEAND